MALDSQVLLVLLAVRSQGTNASAKLEIFKPLKKLISKASGLNLVQETKIDVPVVKKGKNTTEKQTVINLTDEGRTYLETHAGPAAEAAARAAAAQEIAGANVAATREIREHLQADRETFRAQILASMKNKSKSADPTKDITSIAKKLNELAKQVASLEAKMKPAEEADLLARIDDAFAKLDQKLQGRLGTVTALKPTPTVSPDSLRSVLREAYETLSLFIEFDSGVVELPRLYHEARKAIPSLTVHAFHQELESLWSQRVLELKVLNEVRSAKEPDKAIRRGENLYYFVFWPQP